MVQATVFTHPHPNAVDNQLESFLLTHGDSNVIAIEAWAAEDEQGELTYGVKVLWEPSERLRPAGPPRATRPRRTQLEGERFVALEPVAPIWYSFGD